MLLLCVSPHIILTKYFLLYSNVVTSLIYNAKGTDLWKFKQMAIIVCVQLNEFIRENL